LRLLCTARTSIFNFQYFNGSSIDHFIQLQAVFVQVPRHERGELERLEKLVNKYERGQILHVDWLDRITFKAMEQIRERESSKNGNSKLYLIVDFSGFEHRVVFQVL